MSWKEEITFVLKSKKSYPSISTENKTVQIATEKAGHTFVNGVDMGNDFRYIGTDDFEFIRYVVTTALVKIYESTGFLTQAAAEDGVSSSAWMETDTGSQQQTEVEANKAGGANGWKLTKTVTEITVTRNPWKAVVKINA